MWAFAHLRASSWWGLDTLVVSSLAAVHILVYLCALEETLRRLVFVLLLPGDDGAEALAELVGPAAEAGLEDFRFSSTRVGSDGGIALAKALGRGGCHLLHLILYTQPATRACLLMFLLGS